MSLALVGCGASYEFRWLRWVLLRDTVAVHLEGGLVASKFPRFASIGDALAVGPVRIPAAELANELGAIQAGLTGVPLDALVLAPSTASTLYLGVKFSEPRPLTTSELAQIAPIGTSKDVCEYFSSLCNSLVHVCEHPAEDGTVLSIDG
ncbi:MAG: hypothetical protein M3680_04690 [Myxococcota bacterium]|nr:hypothetical protein [Myxococcota bacterium]